MHPWLIATLRTVYPIPLPDKTRSKPLKVLALGLSRSGTDSLRQALIELGYQDVYHGHQFGASPSDAIGWIQLSYAQTQGQQIQASEFDRITGHCEAITDIPAAGFANELLSAYPDTKVIVNYREDVDAWHVSCLGTIEKSRTEWEGFILSFFHAQLFWRFRSMWWVWTRHFGGDFRKDGMDWYRGHNRNLEERLVESDYLRWKVEDGWKPLCEFLGKEVPNQPFPSGNMPAEYFKTTFAATAEWERQARRNLRIFTAFILMVGVVICGYLYDRIVG